VVIITVDDPKEGSLNLASILDSVESVEAVSWPTIQQLRDNRETSGTTNSLGLIVQFQNPFLPFPGQI